MGKLFDLEESGYFYTRLQSPTNDAVAAKIASARGAPLPMLTSSVSPISSPCSSVAGSSDHIVRRPPFTVARHATCSFAMARMGVECTFVDPNCTDRAQAAFARTRSACS